jgi:hypothetical protein
MSKPCTNRRLPKVVLEALEGAEWELVPGKKHVKLVIAGRLVTTISHGHRPNYDRVDLKLATTIRNFRRG